MTADPLATALAWALTGQECRVHSVESLADDLAAAGFTDARLAQLRRAAQDAEEPWPFPVPLDMRRAAGFARFDAALTQVRRQLGLSGLVAAKPAFRPLNRDEQRLTADRPPHW